MNRPEFKRLMNAHNIRGEGTRAALELVLVEGKTAYQAALEVGVSQALISRAKRKIERPLCACCGQPLPARKRGAP